MPSPPGVAEVGELELPMKFFVTAPSRVPSSVPPPAWLRLIACELLPPRKVGLAAVPLLAMLKRKLPPPCWAIVIPLAPQPLNVLLCTTCCTRPDDAESAWMQFEKRLLKALFWTTSLATA